MRENPRVRTYSITQHDTTLVKRHKKNQYCQRMTDNGPISNEHQNDRRLRRRDPEGRRRLGRRDRDDRRHRPRRFRRRVQGRPPHAVQVAGGGDPPRLPRAGGGRSAARDLYEASARRRNPLSCARVCACMHDHFGGVWGVGNAGEERARWAAESANDFVVGFFFIHPLPFLSAFSRATEPPPPPPHSKDHAC